LDVYGVGNALVDVQVRVEQHLAAAVAGAQAAHRQQVAHGTSSVSPR